MAVTKEIPVEKLKPFNLRPVIPFRVAFLKESIKTKDYDPACPLVVQPDNDGYLVVNGCHRLQAVKELGMDRVPVVEYPKDEDPIKLALTTQENSESVQPWDFIDRAFLVKKLYEQLGTQMKVAEKLGWSQPVVSFYLQIANLPEDVITVIRESVIKLQNNTVIKNYNDVINSNLNECGKTETKPKSVDDIWKITWFKDVIDEI
ncbi:ParB/RepB/Spo0J family partition protein [Caldicellulosiruptor acetigenus]|uniref:ParB/RepB/Spo0J family partition protein n=1 Tax=Caldicellulosiruptor acetigenus TaxID=301953 RepID=UPI00040C4A27|nr:ParB N-terminal domain-containing protein [Caldicellulosiruptor acetigenus]WAM36917.1 ParB N-terminal domain-containing protein [Caldicellulosiruptor acetigenus]